MYKDDDDENQFTFSFRQLLCPCPVLFSVDFVMPYHHHHHHAINLFQYDTSTVYITYMIYYNNEERKEKERENAESLTDCWGVNMNNY